MGVGFIISIIFLAALLGIFSRQALQVTEERSSVEDGSHPVNENHPDDSDSSHSHAM
ncbi:hypothetical protein [Alicyclobacillus ferrooxydans]|uniref:hypothetical protein n=1 Tax=Alicyclobacillus ferrooxydans TaxID=471514 RepID=UPI0012ED8553|nr:hypothetical protein [Alicyclobacillus ferrooxydans]